MDPDTPLYETMWALDSAVKSGKALYAGLSNYDGVTMKKAAAILNELHCPFVIALSFVFREHCKPEVCTTVRYECYFFFLAKILFNK